ncbi:hypothetical protein [Herminiimonas contaminans]|uniref:SPP1 Gp6-like portal protein n=1 Tax=Herminiimonas contaminans TaxID=1111140 RepID=A0ABS0EXT5_9BURK|nr:hypothetical protein [Herminiimonas contaminans]MBF8179649.1 hypothetical protein [Herminiimonas contaminans]
MKISERLKVLFSGKKPAALADSAPPLTTEKGLRTRPEDRYRDMYREFWVDHEVRQTILDVREMDRTDGRVKMIHSRVARDVIKGGLVMLQGKPDKRVEDAWKSFKRRTQLGRPEKLKSDARGLIMEGSLPLQLVLDADRNVCSMVRMPSETIVPQVDDTGRFKDLSKAYRQQDLITGQVAATYALWQLQMIRFDPDNFDDLGSMGRPFLDANRSTWKKLLMTEEDLVIRRRVRAPLRLSHVLEGATQPELDNYENKVTSGQHEITTDYFSNKKGSVTPIQGDAALDQIGDIALLLDCFFSGSPMPKGLAGYTEGLTRDILEDLKRDHFDEIDVLQDTLSFGYQQAFNLDLLLKGINPEDVDCEICFAERRTETPSQAADRALKLQALGIPEDVLWEELGFEPQYILQRRKNAADRVDPYPDDTESDPSGETRIKITPGNARKGGSALSIKNR